MDFTPPPIDSGWGPDSKTAPVSVWGLWFSKAWNIITGSVASVSWTPVATNLTGSATLTGSYNKIGDLVHFVISITTAGTTSSTAGSTVITLPFIAAQNDVCYAIEGTAFTSLGNGIIVTGTSNLYPPSWAATANPITISGTFRAS